MANDMYVVFQKENTESEKKLKPITVYFHLENTVVYWKAGSRN